MCSFGVRIKVLGAFGHFDTRCEDERLREAGITYCIAGGGRFAASDARNLPYHAATSVAYGLSRDEAAGHFGRQVMCDLHLVAVENIRGRETVRRLGQDRRRQNRRSRISK